MNLRKTIILAGAMAGICLSGIFLKSCSNPSTSGRILFTIVPADQFQAGEAGFTYQYPGARIVVIDRDKPDESATILTSEFYSACSPHLSYDAKRILFLAQPTREEAWQVWEMDLDKGSSWKITDFKESCSGPSYLPGDRLVFSKEVQDAGAGSAYALFTMNLDGSDLKRITFQPHFDYPSAILRDGRILMLSRQLYPDKGGLMYLAIRPNGTKTELFYKGTKNVLLGNQAYEAPDGSVYFIRQETGIAHKADLICINQNRSLFSDVNLSSDFQGDFYSVFPLPAGELLVSYRPAERKTAGLYNFSLIDLSLDETIIEYENYHVVDPILLEAYERPRNLPDEVNKMDATGQLLCQNINITALQQDISPGDTRKATSIEVLGRDKSLGVVEVEKDGSFYLKVMADSPFRLQTLDESGRILHGPSGWLWLRPSERRGCVGCHEDPELVPENFVPLAVKKQPVSIPVMETQESTLSPAVIIKE